MSRLRFLASIDGLDRETLLGYVQQLEASGFDGVKCADSICYPEHSGSTYPYTESGDRTFLENMTFLDPFVAAGAIFAVTTHLRVVVSVLKLPLRHPVLVGKQAASAAAFSDGRFVLGVGLSPWPDDYQVLDVPWERRGRRLDECITVVRELTDGGYREHHGEFFDFPSIKIQPVPDRPLPILIGGHSEASLLRAARVGDGWSAVTHDIDEVAELLAVIDAERIRVGRADRPFEVHMNLDHDMPIDHLERLMEAGVTHATVRWSNFYEGKTAQQSNLQLLVDQAGSFGTDVIDRLR